MADPTTAGARAILTPDQRLRVYVSAAHPELGPERAAASRAVQSLRMTPVLPAAGARPHPGRDVYRSYLRQSDVFIGIYGQQYGWIAPGMAVSEPEDEYRLSDGMPRLMYVKQVENREPALDALLDEIGSHGGVSYRLFSTAEELHELIAEDLAVLLTERFAGRVVDDDPPTTSRRVPQLPATRTSFVDRTAELEHAVKLLRDPTVRLVTLVGPGGVGKTRLALEVGHRVAEDFPDGAVILWLDAMNDASFMLQALAAELQIMETPERSVMTAIGDRLRGQRMLIVLDNFEHVMAAAPDIADVMALPTASTLLVTSRELLHVRGEHAVALETLGIPDRAATDPQRVAAADAVRLFVDRAEAASQGFALTQDNADDVAAIARKLDGLPLALELAAARVRLLPPGALLSRLERTLDLPAVGGPDLPARQRTLRDTIAWSYQLLEEQEQRALEHLSVFAGGASLEAAVDLLDDVAAPDPIGVLDSLLSKSLLRRTENAEGEVRLRLLAAIREFAGERLRDRSEEAVARDRHARWVLWFAGETAARLHSVEQPRRLSAFDQELENLQVALEWLAGQERTDEALTLAGHLRWYWKLRGHLSAADRWMQRLLQLPGGARHLRGEALTTAGMIAMDVGDAGRAKDMFEEALRLTSAGEDPDAVAWARHGLGNALYGMGAFAEAEELQRDALQAFRAEDDLLGQCAANTRIAAMSLRRGDYVRAEELFQGSLAVRRKIGDPWGVSYVLTALGAVHVLADDYEQAEPYLREALTLTRGIAHDDGTARILEDLATRDGAQGRWGEAVEKFREAERLFQHVGNRPGAARARARLGRAELEAGDRVAAATHAFEAFRLGDDAGDASALAAALEAVGCAVAASGTLDDAARLFGAARGIRERRGVPTSRLHPLGPGRFLDRAERALGAVQLAQLLDDGSAMPPDEILTVVRRAADRLEQPWAGE